MTRKTINRGWLRRQIEAGNIEAKCNYHYTDDYAWDAAVNYQKTDWMPARLNPEQVWEPVNPDNPRGPHRCINKHERNLPGYMNFDSHDLTSSSGRASWDNDGTISLIVHSNLSYDLRLVKPVESDGTRKPKAAPKGKQALKSKIERFARLVTADGLERLKADRIDYPGCEKSVQARIKWGKKYARVDVGTSGRYMVEVATERIFGIKGYGVVHKGRYYGTLDEIDSYFWGDYRGVYKRRQEQAKPQPVNRFEGYFEEGY